MTLTQEAGDEVAKSIFVCGFCGSAPASRNPEANHRACRNSDCLCAQVGHVPNAKVREYQAKYTGLVVDGVKPRAPSAQKRPYPPLTEEQKKNRRKNLVKARKVAAKKRAGRSS